MSSYATWEESNVQEMAWLGVALRCLLSRCAQSGSVQKSFGGQNMDTLTLQLTQLNQEGETMPPPGEPAH